VFNVGGVLLAKVGLPPCEGVAVNIFSVTPQNLSFSLVSNPERIEYEHMKTLTKDIAAKVEERAFSVVFEDDLERCWPSNKMPQARRKKEIQNFAQSQGWTAAILEGAFGTRAIFQKL
jgi:hypothetical protein